MNLSGQEYVDLYATRAKEESKRLEKEAAAAKDAAKEQGTKDPGTGETKQAS